MPEVIRTAELRLGGVGTVSASPERSSPRRRVCSSCTCPTKGTAAAQPIS
jgi:hypothetical protein